MRSAGRGESEPRHAGGVRAITGRPVFRRYSANRRKSARAWNGARQINGGPLGKKGALPPPPARPAAGVARRVRPPVGGRAALGVPPGGRGEDPLGAGELLGELGVGAGEVILVALEARAPPWNSSTIRSSSSSWFRRTWPRSTPRKATRLTAISPGVCRQMKQPSGRRSCTSRAVWVKGPPSMTAASTPSRPKRSAQRAASRSMGGLEIDPADGALAGDPLAHREGAALPGVDAAKAGAVTARPPRLRHLP